ncbi:MAG: carbohydrate deacetylase [SAR324 cluster bacterium]
MPLSPALRLCLFTADDWGLSPAVNEAILDLAVRGIVTRVSMLANGAHVGRGLQRLLALPGLAAGLHFNLSYGRVPDDLAQDPAARPFAVRRVAQDGVRWEYAGSLGGAALRIVGTAFRSRTRFASAVRAHLRHQLGMLQELGVHVQYLDGHHHIHLLPGVLAAMAPMLREAGIEWVRIPLDPRQLLTMRAPLPVAAWLAKRQARRLGLRSLRFHYPSLRVMRTGAGWSGELRRLTEGGPTEIVVHPASRNDLPGLEYPDPYGAGRIREYAALLQLDSTEAASPPGASGPAGDAP